MKKLKTIEESAGNRIPLQSVYRVFVITVISSLSVHYIIGQNKVILLLFHCVMWFTCDLILIRLVEV